MPLDYSDTRRAEALVLLLALACVLLTRFGPAPSFMTMPMMSMPMQMTSSTSASAALVDVQPQPNYITDTVRCMGMLGGLCPLTQVNCVLARTTHLTAPQVQSLIQSVDLVWSSLWPSVPKQPPRR